MIVPLLFGACETKPFADLAQPGTFAKHGVSFDYPSNWELSEAEAGAKDGAKLQVMTLRTPSGAFITIQSFEERMKLRTEDWADRLTQDYARRLTAPGQTLEPSSREAAQREFMGEVRDGLRQGFTLVTEERSAALSAELFVAEFPGGTATVIIQGSQEDFVKGKEGFDLVFKSLKWTRPAPDREIPTIDIVAPPNAEGEPDFEKATIVVNSPAPAASDSAEAKAPSPQEAPKVPSEAPKAATETPQ